MSRVFWHCLDDDKVTMAMAVIATVVVELIDREQIVNCHISKCMTSAIKTLFNLTSATILLLLLLNIIIIIFTIIAVINSNYYCFNLTSATILLLLLLNIIIIIFTIIAVITIQLSLRLLKLRLLKSG